jgi:nucleoside phosphorylase
MIQVEEEADELTLSRVAGPILLCAATRWEAEPLAAALNLRSKNPGRWEGMLGERELVLVLTGVGPLKAGEALSKLSNELYGMALSVGFAGAIQPAVNSGDLVCDVRGNDAALPPLCRKIAASLTIPIHFGKITHSDKVLSSPDEKRALGARERASAVDMETKALREWADERELPVLPARVVLDAIDDRLPRAIPNGEDFFSLLVYVLKNLVDLPTMIATGFKQRRAIANLTRFLTELIPNL